MPRTLAQNAQYIAETIKPAIKSAIEAQGVTVPSTDSFLDYADRIGEIEGGGSGYQLKDLPTGSIATVNDAASLPLNALKVSVEAWQEGSGDPSPSNIRPIHGWDSGEIGVVGKNWLPCEAISTTELGIQFDVLADKKVYVERVNRLFQLVFCNYGHVYLKAGTYKVNGVTGGGAATFYIEFLKNSYTGTRLTYITDGDNALILTEPTEVYVRLVIASSGLPNLGDNTTFAPMIRLVTETATTYEPYKGNQYTQQFPTTIYGAEWDVVGGELKQTDGYIASYNGEALPSTWISDRDVYASGTIPTTGAEVVYKLATPTTIQLSPLSIRMLQGTNNVYADYGEVLEGEYFIGEGGNEVISIDYTTTLYSGTATSLVTADPVTYTATQPCVAYCEWYGTSQTNMCPVLNGDNLTDMYALSDNKKSHIFFLQTGDTLAQRTSTDGLSCYFHMTVYGYQQR